MGFFALALLLAVVLGGEILLYRKFSLSHLEYHCALDREEATEGDVVELVETIKNRKWLPEPWLKSEITTSKWLDFAGAQSIVTDKTRFVPSFFCGAQFSKSAAFLACDLPQTRGFRHSKGRAGCIGFVWNGECIARCGGGFPYFGIAEGHGFGCVCPLAAVSFR